MSKRKASAGKKDKTTALTKKGGDTFLQSNDTSLTWQIPSKMLRLQETREDMLFLVHNLLLALSRDGHQNPALQKQDSTQVSGDLPG